MPDEKTSSSYTTLLLNDSFPPQIDGVANAISNYAREIEEKHGHAAVLTPEFPEANDSIFPFPVYRYPSIDIRKKVGYMAGAPFTPKQTAEMKRSNIGIIHSHCPAASQVLARMIQTVVDVPLVMTYHTKFDYDIQRVVKNRLIQESLIHILVENISASDEVWVVSEGAGKNLRSLGYKGDYVVMENGVDMDKRPASEEAVHALKEQYGIPEGIPVFLFVGRMVWYKNQRIILDGLRRFMDKGGDFRMVMVGDGADLPEMKLYASTLGIQDRCIFTGVIQDREVVRTFYTMADLLLFPSVFDTNGLVVREAAACGTASVLVRGSSAAEGVLGGRNGFLISENAESLAALLTSLKGRESTVRETGIHASEELYISWETAVNKAVERYAIVIDRYRAGHYKHRITLTEGLLNATAYLMDLFSILGTKMSIWE